MDFQSGTITANQGSKGINISNCAGSISFNQYIAGESANPITYNAIDLTANAAMVNFSDVDINMAFSSVSVNSNSSEGIKIENTTGSLRIDTLNISTSSTGIILTNAGKVTIVTGFLTSSAGAAADIDNTLIDFGLTGISSTNSTMQGIDLTNLVSGSTLSVTGMTTVSNALSQGIRIDNAGAGSDIDFAAVEIADRNGTGLLIKNAQGSVDYGAITIPNPKAVGGYGIRIENSSASVSFESADISDTITTVAQTENIGIPTNEGDGDGIFLINNSGSFTLRGGTIRNCDGDGIDIRNCSNIALDGVSIASPGNNGIQAININGSNLLSGCAITRFTGHGNANGITLYGTGSGSMSLTISSSRFSNEDQDGGNAGIFLEGRSNYQAMLTVDDAGGSVGDSIFERISGSAIVITAIDSSVVTANIRDSILRDAHGAIGNNAIDIVSSGNATARFIVENNRLENILRVSTFAGAVGFGSTSTSKMTGKIRGNDLDNVRGSAYGSIIGDTGIASSLDATINDNYVDDAARYGLRIRLDGSASGVVRASGNQMGTVIPVGNDSSTRDAIEIRSRDNTGDYYASLRGNHIITEGSTGKVIDIDSEDNATIHSLQKCV